MMRVRVKPQARSINGGNFRRVGITFSHEWQEVDPSTLSPAQLDLLRSPESARYLEVEGAEGVESGQRAHMGHGTVGTPDEAVEAARKADASLPEPPEPPHAPPTRSRR